MMNAALTKLRGKRIGLVTNQSSVTNTWQLSRVAYHEALNLHCLYAPEHGLGGNVERGEGVRDSDDPLTGLEIRSLYQDEATQIGSFDDLDGLLFDIQDVGVRFYTYISTLRQIMSVGLPVTVIDRPNPLGGTIVEGGLLAAEDESFVGPRGLPIRYGLTIGELAHWMNEAYDLKCELTTVDLQGWKRSELWFNSSRPWVMTSPAIAHQESTFFYPGMCLLEGTNLNEGRGTSAPFELLGSPFIDPYSLSADVNSLNLNGVVFTPISYTPTGGVLNHGLYGHITDVSVFRPVETTIRLLSLIRRRYPDELTANDYFRKLAGFDFDELDDSEILLERLRSESATFALETRRLYRYE